MKTERHVAFVRNIMVGRRGLTRDVLLEIFASAGAPDAHSYIATGNFGFTARRAQVRGISAGVESGSPRVEGGTGSPHGLVERLLKVRATARNWNTIERILRAEAKNV